MDHAPETSSGPLARLRRSFLPFLDHRYLDIQVARVAEFARSTPHQIPEGALVLDAGAGECRLRPHFARHRYVGCDLGVGDSNWDYTRLDCISGLEALPFQNEAFDAILLIEVLEHLRHPVRSLTEMARILKPGGQLFLSTPFLAPDHQVPYDFQRYTRHGLAGLLADSGFEDVKITALEGYLTTLVYHSRWLFELPLIAFPALAKTPVVGSLCQLALRLIRHPMAWAAEKLDPLIWRQLSKRLPGPYVIGYTVTAKRARSPN